MVTVVVAAVTEANDLELSNDCNKPDRCEKTIRRSRSNLAHIRVVRPLTSSRHKEYQCHCYARIHYAKYDTNTNAESDRRTELHVT